MICKNCGAVIETEQLRYIGGQGYVPCQVCQDETACWARWDKQHGFTDTPALKEMGKRTVAV